MCFTGRTDLLLCSIRDIDLAPQAIDTHVGRVAGDGHAAQTTQPAPQWTNQEMGACTDRTPWEGGGEDSLRTRRQAIMTAGCTQVFPEQHWACQQTVHDWTQQHSDVGNRCIGAWDVETMHMVDTSGCAYTWAWVCCTAKVACGATMAASIFAGTSFDIIL